MADPSEIALVFQMMKQVLEKTMGTPSSTLVPAGTSTSTPAVTVTTGVLEEGAKSESEKPSSPPTEYADTPMKEAEIPEELQVMNPTPLQQVRLGEEENPIDPDLGVEETSKKARRTLKMETKLMRSLKDESDDEENPPENSPIKASADVELDAEQEEESASEIPKSVKKGVSSEAVKKATSPTSSHDMVSSGTARDVLSHTQSGNVKDDAESGDSEPVYPPGSPHDVTSAFSKTFYSKHAKAQYKIICNRPVRVEKQIDVLSFKKYGMDVFLKERGNDSDVISLDLIDDVVSTITGGLVTKWTNKISTSKLTFLYSILHKIIVCNWSPTTNTPVLTVDQAFLFFKLGTKIPFSLGHYIFDYVMKAATKTSNTSILPFPCLIYPVMVEQGVKLNKKKIVTETSTMTIVKPKGNDDHVMYLPYNLALSSTADSRDVDQDVLNSFIKQMDSMIHQSTVLTNAMVEHHKALRSAFSTQKGGVASSIGGPAGEDEVEKVGKSVAKSKGKKKI
ncbi:hypothetical protein C2S51_037702 [Perilla frutescens var. frutescens]|nr:hypothetical protein C2S51_037702 [Perilla frutescens var. frutescens]